MPGRVVSIFEYLACEIRTESGEWVESVGSQDLSAERRVLENAVQKDGSVSEVYGLVIPVHLARNRARETRFELPPVLSIPTCHSPFSVVSLPPLHTTPDGKSK